jgi:hypothetical protein
LLGAALLGTALLGAASIALVGGGRERTRLDAPYQQGHRQQRDSECLTHIQGHLNFSIFRISG